MTDVAPTLAALLGEAIPASSQGQILTSMLVLDPARKDSLEKALEVQQNRLAAAYESAIESGSAPLPEIQDPLLTSQIAMEAARYTRQSAERLPRLLLAGLAALLPGVFLYRQWRRDWSGRRIIIWSLGGAMLYLLVFNLQYLLLGRRAYSLSYVNGVTSFLLPFGTAILVAFGVSWLVASVGLGGFRPGPRRAAELSLDLGLANLYLLYLPALWSFTLNGITATWTLPDMTSSSVALFSLVQVVAVALLSLAFAGLSALVVTVKRRSLAGRE